MPTTRRSTRSSTGAGKQSTLSFKHKVTKAIQTGKEGYKSPSRAKEYIPEPTPEPTTAKATPLKTDDDDDNSQPPLNPTTPTAAGDDESHATLAVQIKPAPQPAVAAAPEKSDAELKAAKITDKAIERYWSDIESSRNARAVHKKHGEGLTTGEKVLRYFDVSSQYGPCIGIARMKRWQRAQRLGLNPPVEVLAVLLKEEAKGNAGIERAHMDELLNSSAVGSVGV